MLAVNILGDGFMRVWSRYYRDYALLYDVTRDVRHWNNVSSMTTDVTPGTTQVVKTITVTP